MRGTVGGFAIGIHCKCCESNLTTPAVLHKGATYKLFKTTSQAYRRRKQLCAKQKKEIVSIKCQTEPGLPPACASDPSAVCQSTEHRTEMIQHTNSAHASGQTWINPTWNCVSHPGSRDVHMGHFHRLTAAMAIGCSEILLPNAAPACHNLWTCCHSPGIRRRSLLSNISTLHSSVSPFILPFSSSVHSPCWVTSLPLGSLTPLLWPWPCPPWVIYHGPGGEPLGLQAPVSPCNRLFVAPSKQVSDQQKSIKAWWAFLSQLGSGH
ncbi:uncharacterized protein LOC122883029 isoform X1 [Siniperca chuatsi]|uniref:uncharacterized protein LOC122883029 isoform X1 n=1 Tax=Siniperca chuatsi TaxID=119488 RepID=UPI001CE08305|nr:uncharacterized protein LOC122883029 isoform X1 [Siniperca chuatsi]